MSRFDNILGLLGLARKAAMTPPSSSSLGDGGDPFTLWATGSKKLEAQKAMGVNAGWVYAAVRAISEEIANAHFRLFQIKKDGTHEEIFDHDVLTLLEGVNAYQTGYELRYLMASHLELAGNAYWLLDGVKDASSVPTGIYPLSPARMKVVRSGDFRNPIAKYTYTEKNTPVDYQPYEILHLKYPDPNDMIEGIGTVAAIAQWIDTDNYASEWNRRFFLNGARIGGFLESENSLTTEQMKFLRTSFEDIYKGVDNAHKVAALPKGVKYTPGSDSQKDLDFNEGQKTGRDKILAGFRTPKTILGSSEQETNRSTAETADYVFAARTITPKLRMITSYLNEFFVPRFGSDLYLEFANVIPEDRAQRIAEMTAATAAQPAISVNEAREEYLGLGPISNGENVMTDFSKQPLGAPIKAVHKPTMKTKNVIKSRGARNAEKRKEIGEDAAKKAAEAVVSAMAKARNKATITDMTDDEYEIVWKGFVSRVTPFETAFQKAIQAFNGDQQKVVLSNLGDATKDIDEDALFNLKDWISSLVDLATPILADLYKKEGSEAAKLLGRDDIDVLTPETKKALDKSIELMANTYNETTRALLKGKLEQGLQEGLSQPDLKKIIKDVYEFSDDQRALTVARTETFRVANEGTREAWTQSGVVKDLKWYTAADERVCEFCGPLHGTIVDIESNFFDKGDTVPGANGGSMSVEYDDIGGGSLHPNCRCYIRPETIEI